ncbi:MAG: adenosine kinase [Acidimicrobiales bacterium]
MAVGSALVDVLVRVPDGFPESLGLVRGSMGLVDLAQAESLRHAALEAAIDEVQVMAGGSAVNTAVGVAGLGGSAACLARVAEDELGRDFVTGTKGAGVHFEPAPGRTDATTNLATGRCLTLVTPDAERTMCTYLGAASQLSPLDLDAMVLGGARIVYVEGYLWDLPETIDVLRQAMSAAKVAGAKLAFSLSDPFCVERHRREFLSLIEGELDLVFANEAEVCLLYGTDDVAAAAKQLGATGVVGALTRGAAGSMVMADGEAFTVAADPVASVVDTTGAGDLYAAGFMFGMTHGRTWTDCARLASLAAAEIIGHIGARPEVSLAELARSARLV